MSVTVVVLYNLGKFSYASAFRSVVMVPQSQLSYFGDEEEEENVWIPLPYYI